ncbi:MAG: pseudouridine-5'-phosphate glycosidase [Clostridiales bacterium]|nr:pseudouridine-5'-phosphate glycosidase [Clostridiales bacterium]
MWENIIDIKEEVKEALEKGIPIVSLESTIISHGMPYPENVETAKVLEDIIRENGAVPATIGIIKGRIKVGLEEDELEFLAKDKNIVKVSRRDFPEVIALKKSGATTVAATMIISDIVGIKVFATGGIGGVHRGYSEILDISQDLEELSRTNVAVICAGVKSILDIRSTLEYLETKSVPVYVLGSDEFPAFYTRNSGIVADTRIDNIEELALIVKTKWDYGFNGGVVVANPIPEEFSFNSEEIDEVINKALKEAKEKQIEGKKVTPYLLSKIKEITKGESLKANIELVKHNTKVAAELAVKMTNI